MKKIAIIFLFFALCSTASATDRVIENIKVFPGEVQIQVLGNEKIDFSAVSPADQQYMYVDLKNVQIRKKQPKIVLEKGQGFEFIRVGRHTNPNMIRFVFNAPENSPVPFVNVHQKGNIIKLEWNPTLARQNKEAIQDLHPCGITKVKDKTFFTKLVEKVKGCPLNPPQVAHVNIDAQAPITGKPTMEIIDDDKEDTDFFDGIINDLNAYIIKSHKSVLAMWNSIEMKSALGKVTDFFTSESIASTGEESTAIKINTRTNSNSNNPTTATTTKGPKTKNKEALTLEVTPQKSSGPLQPVVAKLDPKQKKAIDDSIEELRKTVKASYERAIQKAQKIATKEASQIKKAIEKDISLQNKASAKTAMVAMLKEYDEKLNELKQQHIVVTQLISEVKSQKHKMDIRMREINARNGVISCREEPKEGFKVVFLPAGSLRSGLDALAQSVNMHLLWEAPRNDYYIDRAIMLDGMTFEENLMVIHNSLAQNNVYFSLEPNYNSSILRVRANELKQDNSGIAAVQYN